MSGETGASGELLGGVADAEGCFEARQTAVGLVVWEVIGRVRTDL